MKVLIIIKLNFKNLSWFITIDESNKEVSHSVEHIVPEWIWTGWINKYKIQHICDLVTNIVENVCEYWLAEIDTCTLNIEEVIDVCRRNSNYGITTIDYEIVNNLHHLI
jgi:hypothetical protein